MASQKDHWSSKDYTAAAAFVPQLTSKVVSWLEASPGEDILDIGCGDGILTAQIAKATEGGRVLGLDSSQSMISTAQKDYTSSNCTFRVLDCTKLDTDPEAISGQWDKVFSNAALHWILRNPDTRIGVFHSAYKALKSGGRFVFEMGGKGNIAEVHAAIISAITAQGIPIAAVRKVDPWFFPSDTWMRKTLENAGFEVEKCELEYRPTKNTPKAEDGSGGLEGWIRLMGAQLLESAPEGKRQEIIQHALQTLETIVTREEDGSTYIGYVRLRAVARKK